MSADIEKKYGIKPELSRSKGGAFEVYKDNTKIFSRIELKRFPKNSEEIFEKIDATK